MPQGFKSLRLEGCGGAFVAWRTVITIGSVVLAKLQSAKEFGFLNKKGKARRRSKFMKLGKEGPRTLLPIHDAR